MAKILIIEDEPELRDNLVEVLKLQGFETFATGDGRKGVQFAKNERPDLILCDVTMPVIDGYGVLRLLREDENIARIPLIFLTARGEQADVRAGMNLGADDYLIKPVSVDDLLSAIHARLERAHQQSGFNANFSSSQPLEKLGLSTRESEILLWVAQGKTNGEVGTILGITAATVKKHLEHIYAKLGVEGRNGATLKALEVLSSVSAH
jgi:DNA-binding NarL/FixJ family response regulator